MASKEITSSKQTEECIINCLPRDLIERIFLGLPVSTLLTCIGVCKQWYNFIRDPQFVTSHLRQAPRCTLLFFHQEPFSSDNLPTDAIIFDEAWSQSTWAVPVIGPDDFLCGTCNGLLCLYTETSRIKIANLATGECLHLAKPVKKLRDDHFSFYSFGFHPGTKEYKVTHFLGEHQSYSQGTFHVIQVYTLGSEKWKDIRTPEALSLSSVKNSGVIHIDGTMYWLTDDTGASWNHAVISFDLSEETFARIQLPATALVGSDSHGYWITEIDRKVCIATAEVSRDLPKVLAGELQIWTLDNRVEQRWSQKWNIQHSMNCIPGPHFVHKDKIVMLSHDCNLYSHVLIGMNCETKLSNMVALLDFRPYKPENMQSYICVKSLVRLHTYKKAGIVCKPKQCEGWKLKKWEEWEDMRRNIEDAWNNVHEMEQETSSQPHRLGGIIKELLQNVADEIIRERVILEINHILEHLPDCPYQHPRSLLRLSLVEQMRDLEKLKARLNGVMDMIKVSGKAVADMCGAVKTYVLDRPGVHGA
ncbi:unnamed protein product [Urochloa decumbens]|uniref:F-box domain-containing protein n=1 Tax=Urochloa decumbens TaxID=240449 RepID=A0ABC9FVJ8_9POAL